MIHRGCALTCCTVWPLQTNSLPNSDPGVAEGFEQISRVQTLEVGSLVSNCSRDTIQISSMAYCGPTTPMGRVRRESLLCGVLFVCPSDAQV